MKSFTKFIILFFILIVLIILYRRFEEKRKRQESMDDYNYIQKYLLGDENDDLNKLKKPILWIHVPYEYNSRNWLSFGSRSSFNLNQPYLYFTVKSIIKNCDESFKICIIDDYSFKNLIPGWNIDMKKISSPVLDNIRQMGIMKLLYTYGGINVPISFLCTKDLIGLYKKATKHKQMFLCENKDTNITSTSYNFYPDCSFIGCEKENPICKQFIDFIQRTISTDFTNESIFLGDLDRWCESKIKSGQIYLINGIHIGVKTSDDRYIGIEDLLSQNYLDFHEKTYGILIPAKDILKRRHYEWFSRLSHQQILESETIIGKHILLSNVSECSENNYNEKHKNKQHNSWIGFWKMPLIDIWGLKPNYSANYVIKDKYPDY